MKSKGGNLIHCRAAWIILFILLVLFLDPWELHALPGKDEHVWIEYGESIREKDGSVTLALKINYGKFTGEKKDISELVDLRAFFALAGKEKQGGEEFNETEILEENGRRLVKITSSGHNRFIVLIMARKNLDQVEYWYSATTSLVLFGHSPAEAEQPQPLSPVFLIPSLKISIKPMFHYWPQTGDPVDITCTFNSSPRPDQLIYLLDERSPPLVVRTDETGSFTYVPPEDRELNRQGSHAFKQTVIVSEEIEGKSRHIATRTLLLHRSRYQNRNLRLGMWIFGSAAFGTCVVMVLKRRRFRG